MTCNWCPAFKSFLFSHTSKRRAVAALARTGDHECNRLLARRKKLPLPHQTRWLNCDQLRFTGRIQRA